MSEQPNPNHDSLVILQIHLRKHFANLIHELRVVREISMFQIPLAEEALEDAIRRHDEYKAPAATGDPVSVRALARAARDMAQSTARLHVWHDMQDGANKILDGINAQRPKGE